MKRDPIVNHKVMASIKGKDTKIELALREQLKNYKKELEDFGYYPFE